jgi:hypothetical protein
MTFISLFLLPPRLLPPRPLSAPPPPPAAVSAAAVSVAAVSAVIVTQRGRSTLSIALTGGGTTEDLATTTLKLSVGSRGR